MIVSPGETLRLWTIYQENGTTETGVTDLKVKVTDSAENVLLAGTVLTESGSTGYYYYDWDTSSVTLGKRAKAIYLKGTDELYSEQFTFDIIEDQDGIML